MTAASSDNAKLCVYASDRLGRYGFPEGHPFGPWRMTAFREALGAAGLDDQVTFCEPVMAERQVIEYFHTHEYVERVKQLSVRGEGYLDAGDTPAFPGVYEAAATVVGAVTDALRRVMEGSCRRAFVPIAGLHHAHRDRASGFCVFNDCAIAVEFLRREFQIRRIAYVDIDAHHGDGVFYAFEEDPDLIFADIHEDGRYLFPGTGSASESGKGPAQGSKLNIPLPPGADDEAFLAAWPRLESFIRQAEPEFILMQCGADSIAGDPLTHLRYTARSHRHAARSLCALADSLCQGRIVGLGGGGYRRENIAAAWTAVVASFME
ncbi:MAG TPA: acetoin utilization protein AcuC [Gammaproteobacteria bacterium]|nr:acetoin utilization protein AcuC [Gammaproteobacteria bacterium]